LNWYKKAASEDLLQALVLQIKDTYSGQSITPEMLDELRKQPDGDIRRQIEELKQEKDRDLEYRRQKKEIKLDKEKWIKDVPPEIEYVGGAEAIDTYVHCRPGSVEEMQEMIQQKGGLPLMRGLDNVSYDNPLLKGYNSIFVGCNETWAAVLARDYDYSGHFVYITFSNLPEGFYVTDDPNPMDKTNLPNSYVILSKHSVIPLRNIDTIEDGGTWESILDNNPAVKYEFGDEEFN